MAQAPTRFKKLIAGKSPAAVYRVLKENDFLEKTDGGTRKQIIALVEQACRPRESDPIPIPGPTPLDSLAGELLSFLSEKGVDAYYDYSGAADREPTRRPWWQWWRKPNPASEIKRERRRGF
jgi:hypothetical protein